MPVFASLLRGINVGGNKKIKMGDLRELYASLGLENTQTLLQSGNAVFQTDRTDRMDIRSLIEKGIEQKFNFDVQVVLRNHDELQTIIDQHPFSDMQLDEPSKISVVFLDAVPTDAAFADLVESNKGQEIIFPLAGKQLYIFYSDGKGKSKLDNNRIERKLQVRATARNWNTTQKLHKLLQDMTSGT